MPAAGLPPPVRPLVVRFGALGDMVLLTALLGLLHRRYDAPCDVLTSGAWGAPLYAGHPDVGSVIALNSRKRPYWSDPAQWRAVAALRGRPRGPVYVADEFALDKLAALLDRAGIAAADTVWLHRRDDVRAEHWLDRWAQFARTAPPAWADACPAAESTNAGPLQPRLVVDPAARAALPMWLAGRGLADRPLLLVHAGNKRTLRRGRLGRLGDAKSWPDARWIGLLRALAATHPDVALLLTGTPPEQALLAALVRGAALPPQRLQALGDDLPLPRLLALFEVAAGMVSIDTGPAHAAAALGCPLLVLYGAAPPGAWRPRGPGAIVTLGGPPQRSRVDQIGLDEVLQACAGLPLRAASGGTRA